MFVKNFAALFTFTLFIFCDSSFVKNLRKCHLNDLVCLQNVYDSSVKRAGKDGIKELNIPPVDPIHLTNVTVNIPNMVNITMVDGVAKGIKNCVMEKFSLNIKEERSHHEITCDLTIKGHYVVDASSVLIAAFLGEDTIHGDGNGKIKIDNLHLKFDFPFYAQRREDGEIYLKTNYDLVKYDYDIGGPVVMFADNLYIGNQEVSKQVTDILNQNWRFFLSTFGQPFVDKAMEFYFKFGSYFFDKVPARHYIIDDLSPYARP